MKSYRAESLHRPATGVCTGIVETTDDPEKEGRVKVRFPWLDNRTITEWCRVCQPYAGNRYGIMFVPEVGDEVLVSFVHGDMTEPVILGGLYNAKDKPPGFKDAQTDKKAIRTKAGHELILEDTASSLVVTLRSKDGHVIKLDDTNGVLSFASKDGHQGKFDDRSKTITFAHSGGSASIKFDSSGGITVEASTITLTAGTININ